MNLIEQDTRPAADDTRLIPLTQGQFAIVDASDFEWLNQWKWNAQWNPKTRSFYAKRTLPVIDGKRTGDVWMHRMILGFEPKDGRIGDHQNGLTLDNRRSNLRVASTFQNQQNRRVRRDSTSGFKGVTSFRNKWKAEISAHGKGYYLGLFATPELAHEAYKEAAARLHGEFANP